MEAANFYVRRGSGARWARYPFEIQILVWVNLINTNTDPVRHVAELPQQIQKHKRSQFIVVRRHGKR